MFIVCLAISLAIWLAFVYAAYSGSRKRAATQTVSARTLVITGTALAAVAVFWPVYASRYADDAAIVRIFKILILSLRRSIRPFLADTEFDVIQKATAGESPTLSAVYSLWSGFLFALAPMLTFSFVLSLFKNITAALRYRFAFNRDVYVFSDMNERSMILAESLRRKYPTAALVFTDVYPKKEEEAAELYERARTLHAICLSKDILDFRFDRHSPGRTICFFLIGGSEDENISQTIALIRSFRERAHTAIYLFSENEETELYLSGLDKGGLFVRRVNSTRSLIYRNLYENGSVLFTGAGPAQDGLRQIGAVVVGMGGRGTEMLKALSWYCQMDGYALNLTGFDRNSSAASVFRAACPDLMNPAYNGAAIPGDAQYRIRIHGGVNVDSAEFAEEIGKLRDTTFVFVSLGNDAANIRCAVRLRALFERMGVHPAIHAVVSGAGKQRALDGAANFRGTPYDVRFIGSMEEMYSADVILNSELEQEGLRRHLKWGKEADFWNYEYNYRSSLSSALHLRARIACGMPGAGKPEAELTEAEGRSVELLEHRRWAAYMRSEGYVFSGAHDPATRSDLAKMHHDLIPYDELTEAEKRKDRVSSIAE